MALPYLRAQLSHKTIKTPRTQPLAFGSVKINWSIMPSWLLSIRHCCKCSCCLFFSTCLGLLHFTYAKKSQTRIFSLHDPRASIKGLPPSSRLSPSIALSLNNDLATAGAPITNDELVVKILSGLGPFSWYFLCNLGKRFYHLWWWVICETNLLWALSQTWGSEERKQCHNCCYGNSQQIHQVQQLCCSSTQEYITIAFQQLYNCSCARAFHQ